MEILQKALPVAMLVFVLSSMLSMGYLSLSLSSFGNGTFCCNCSIIIYV